ncbi:MAG: phosphonate ABC transporter, permease protein PhnE [Alphaproteobacteria bacterium]|jgi:phosphonate transport system permease protein|nr:phosphonate ABC transporter, permease protein PhnE [Alphaproteobacteria bacterium]
MSQAALPARQWRPPRLIANPSLRRAFVALAVLYLLWSFGSLEIDWGRVAQGLPRAGNMLGRMFPPDFSRWELLWQGLVESVEMALAASAIGMVLAVPLGLAAAVNIAPKPVYLVARGVIVLTRTFHEVIIAIFFVKIFGFGPLAGVLTLVVASLSFIAKMLAEDIENMNPGQVEAVRATGASFPKVLIYGIAPQILPRYLGVSIYRLDANIRHSTVVGIVGAGGIGQTLSATFSRYDYDFSLAILLTIIALVFIGEFFSNWVRGRLR